MTEKVEPGLFQRLITADGAVYDGEKRIGSCRAEIRLNVLFTDRMMADLFSDNDAVKGYAWWRVDRIRVVGVGLGEHLEFEGVWLGTRGDDIRGQVARITVFWLRVNSSERDDPEFTHSFKFAIQENELLRPTGSYTLRDDRVLAPYDDYELDGDKLIVSNSYLHRFNNDLGQWAIFRGLLPSWRYFRTHVLAETTFIQCWPTTLDSPSADSISAYLDALLLFFSFFDRRIYGWFLRQSSGAVETLYRRMDYFETYTPAQLRWPLSDHASLIGQIIDLVESVRMKPLDIVEGYKVMLRQALMALRLDLDYEIGIVYMASAYELIIKLILGRAKLDQTKAVWFSLLEACEGVDINIEEFLPGCLESTYRFPIAQFRNRILHDGAYDDGFANDFQASKNRLWSLLSVLLIKSIDKDHPLTGYFG